MASLSPLSPPRAETWNLYLPLCGGLPVESRPSQVTVWFENGCRSFSTIESTVLPLSLETMSIRMSAGSVRLEQVVELDVLLAVEVGGLRVRLDPLDREAVDGVDRVLGLDLDLLRRLRLGAVTADDHDLAGGRSRRHLRDDRAGVDRGRLDLDPPARRRGSCTSVMSSSALPETSTLPVSVTVRTSRQRSLQTTSLTFGGSGVPMPPSPAAAATQLSRAASVAKAARQIDPRRTRSRARGARAQVLVLFRSGLRG